MAIVKMKSYAVRLWKIIRSKTSIRGILDNATEVYSNTLAVQEIILSKMLIILYALLPLG